MTQATRPSSSQRGYGGGWGRLRASWQRRIDSGETVRCRRGVNCNHAEMLEDTSIVGGQIMPGQDWDLGHDFPPHPEHPSCRHQSWRRGVRAK